MTDLPDLPARGKDPDVWPAAATSDADTAAELPTRQPGKTGLAWTENARLIWTETGRHSWQVRRAPSPAWPSTGPAAPA